MPRTIELKKMKILICPAYEITLRMLAYLFLSKVATLTQSNSLSTIFPYILSVSLQVWTISTAIFAGIEAFAGNKIFADSIIRSPSTFKRHYL